MILCISYMHLFNPLVFQSVGPSGNSVLRFRSLLVFPFILICYMRGLKEAIIYYVCILCMYVCMYVCMILCIYSMYVCRIFMYIIQRDGQMGGQMEREIWSERQMKIQIHIHTHICIIYIDVQIDRERNREREKEKKVS